MEAEEEERNGKNIPNSEYTKPNQTCPYMQAPEGPGAWGVLLREEERLRRRGRALRAHELPKGIDKVESLESSVQK